MPIIKEHVGYASLHELLFYMISITVQRTVLKSFDELDRIFPRPLLYHLKTLESDFIFTWVILCIEPFHHLIPSLDGPRP